MILLQVVWVLLLTLFTQVGGVIWLINRLLFFYLRKKWAFPYAYAWRTGGFALLYLLSSLVIIPVLAGWNGLKALPLSTSGELRPLRAYTWLCNRHYVKPELYELVSGAARTFRGEYPAASVLYLDGCFPFFENMPLLPHLSHTKGEKLDIAFQYDRKDGFLKGSPALTGYGVAEAPSGDEVNTVADCHRKGYLLYDFTTRYLPASGREDFELNADRTKALVRILLEQPTLGKLFLEPHLVKRWKLQHRRLRFQGCQAVRHDDHIHIEI